MERDEFRPGPVHGVPGPRGEGGEDAGPAGPTETGRLDPFRLGKILRRVRTGHYDSPAVAEAVAARLLRGGELKGP